MNKHTVEMLHRLHDAGISTKDALSIRRISMTLRRWFELECGDSNDYASWAIETLPVTKERLTKRSSPAQHPQYDMTIPAGTECQFIPGNGDKGSWAIADTSRVKGSNPHDLEHYHIWLADTEVIEVPFMITRPHQGKSHKHRIANREAGARKRLAKIMAKYPTLQTYIQTDPRGASVYIIRPGDIPAGASADSCYNHGIAVHQ